MASPQKENGYTPIANELMEQLYKLPLSGTKFRILLLVFRYTYGFNRKEHCLSENFIAAALSTNKRQIQREIKNLIDADVLVIVKQATFNSSKIVAFNKNYDKWNYDLVTKMSTVTEKSLSDKNVTPNSSMPDMKSSSSNSLEEGGMTFLPPVTFSPPGDILAAQENNSSIDIINNIQPPKKPRKENPNTNIINFFCEQYKVKFENAYMTNWARDGTIIKSFLDAGYTEEYMKNYIIWFLNCNDDYLNAQGYNVPLLKSRIEKYHLTLKKPVEKSKYPNLKNYNPGGNEDVSKQHKS